ncbi:MAG: PEP-CTERM sorting domain-containing protein, partial [Verrucomicrobiae bacterium]|nr:PEP-CTERM sorting domain-containing protein [Verrucomicrobiae bacterium]
ISNLSGGLILGKGTLTSFNVTNFYDIGDNLVTSNLEVGAKIVNATGGTILASGETLVLKNGFSANTQAGMIGTTNGGTLRLGDGTLALTNSGTGTVRLQGGALQLGSLVNEGSLVGAGAVQAASVISSGLLSPGFSPGTLSFSNDLTLTVAAQLVFEIAGTNALAYDRLLIGGAFAKAGTVLVTNLGWGFAAGDTFDFFEAGSLSGSFTSMLPLPDLAGGLTWDTTLFESHGIMSVVGVIPEPGVVSLLLLASAGFLVFRQRRK